MNRRLESNRVRHFCESICTKENSCFDCGLPGYLDWLETGGLLRKKNRERRKDNEDV